MSPSWTELRIEPLAQPPAAPQLRALLRLWLDKGRGGLPNRADIDPLLECDPRLLPHLCLIDVLEHPVDFRYRLVGTALVAVEGRDNTGRRLGECGLGRYEEPLRAVYEQVVAERSPRGFAGTLLWRRTDPLRVEALHLPLTRRGDGVEMILGASLFLRAHNGRPVQWIDR